MIERTPKANVSFQIFLGLGIYGSIEGANETTFGRWGVGRRGRAEGGEKNTRGAAIQMSAYKNL